MPETAVVPTLTARAVWDATPLLVLELSKPDKRVAVAVKAKLARALHALRVEVTIIDAVRRQLLEEYARRDDEGKPTLGPTGESLLADPLAFQRQWAECLAGASTVTLPTVLLGELPEDLSVTALSALIDLGMLAPE